MNKSLLSLGSLFGTYRITFSLCHLCLCPWHFLAEQSLEKCLVLGPKPNYRVACDFNHSTVRLCDFGLVTYILLALVSLTVKVVGSVFPTTLLNQHRKTQPSALPGLHCKYFYQQY